MSVWRVLFAVTAWLFVAAVVLQVFFAGMFLFGAGDRSLHIEFGYLAAMLPLLPLLLAWPARVGRRLVLLTVLLLVLGQVQTALPLAQADLPAVAALHPVNALVLLLLGGHVAQAGTALARARASAGAPAAEAARAEAAGAETGRAAQRV